MKKIAICGSMSASSEMVAAAETLRLRGYEVFLPRGAEQYADGTKHAESICESTTNKREGDLIRGYYETIRNSDAILIVNVKKRGKAGYVGGNTFLEMAFAHVLNKPVYLTEQADTTSGYIPEIEAMDHIVIDGDLSRIDV